MAASSYNVSIFIAFICFIYGFGIMGEGRLCLSSSETYTDVCHISSTCFDKCKAQEGAIEGACLGLECVCSFPCSTSCERPSGIWKGPCFIDKHCSVQCREKENANRGHCSDFKCMCLYNCN